MKSGEDRNDEPIRANYGSSDAATALSTEPSLAAGENESPA